jgi:hypothetical protein
VSFDSARPQAQDDSAYRGTYVPPVIGNPDSYAQGSWAALTGRLVLRAMISPRLALDLFRTAWAFRRRNWLRRAPFLPLPDATYLRWRMYTAYGDENAVPPMEDVVRFSRWRRTTMRV